MIAMIAGGYWSLVDPSITLGVIVGLGLRGDGRRGALDAIQDDDVPPDPPAGEHRRTPLAGLGLRRGRSRSVARARSRSVARAQPAARERRLLVVAAPMVSAGGVYSYLERALPEIGERGWKTGLLWAARVPVDSPPADWSRPVPEAPSLRARQRQLQGAVRTAIEDWRPDLVLSVLPQSDVACARVRRDVATPWVAMLHGSPFPRAGEMPLIKRFTWRSAVTVAYRRADRLITVSRVLAETVQSELSLPFPVTNVGTGVDLPQPTERLQRDEPTIGYVGRLSHEKAPDVFLDISRRVGTKALIFGDGPLAPMVGAAAGEQPGLEFRGWADRDDALAEIDVLVLPSRREALPLVLLEAGARRVCTVARDTGGIGEVMGFDSELSRHCLLPRTASGEDFAAAVRHLLDHPDERNRLADRLHEVVRDQFSLDVHIDRLLTAVEPVVRRWSPR
jgi:glycosyltransferase involved in cell wall biosynthesis